MAAVSKGVPQGYRATPVVSHFVSHWSFPARNSLVHSHLKLEPVVGLEPTTDGLQNRCSTTELNWLNYFIPTTYDGNLVWIPSIYILNLYMVAFPAMQRCVPSS